MSISLGRVPHDLALRRYDLVLFGMLLPHVLACAWTLPHAGSSIWTVQHGSSSLPLGGARPFAAWRTTPVRCEETDEDATFEACMKSACAGHHCSHLGG